MTRNQIDDHIKELRERATKMAMEDYPTNEDELRKWRSDVDNIRDLKLLAFLSHYLPNKVTMQPIGF
jgi:hypothetical protein